MNDISPYQAIVSDIISFYYTVFDGGFLMFSWCLHVGIILIYFYY